MDQSSRRVFITDCEGPITKNDNAAELCEAFVPGGDRFFKKISLYDDYLAEVARRPGYKAGDTLRLILPFFKAMGKVITLQGVAGSGQHTKMANQIVIAGTMIGVCEALVDAKKAGLNLGKLVETISKGAAGCWTLDNLAGRVLKGDYQPGFMIDQFVKDMGIALEVA